MVQALHYLSSIEFFLGPNLAMLIEFATMEGKRELVELVLMEDVVA